MSVLACTNLSRVNLNNSILPNSDPTRQYWVLPQSRSGESTAWQKLTALFDQSLSDLCAADAAVRVNARNLLCLEMPRWIDPVFQVRGEKNFVADLASRLQSCLATDAPALRSDACFIAIRLGAFAGRLYPETCAPLVAPLLNLALQNPEGSQARECMKAVEYLINARWGRLRDTDSLVPSYAEAGALLRKALNCPTLAVAAAFNLRRYRFEAVDAVEELVRAYKSEYTNCDAAGPLLQAVIEIDGPSTLVEQLCTWTLAQEDACPHAHSWAEHFLSSKRR